MKEFLQGLLYDLERRCVVIRDKLAAGDDNPDTRQHAMTAYMEIETTRREVVNLLSDPNLGNPLLLPNQLQNYRHFSEREQLIEFRLLPFIERYNSKDQLLTRFCSKLIAQTAWPLPPPLVATFSTEYYWTFTGFSIICIPFTEDCSLLGLPDLCHELGHILLLHYETELIGDFCREIQDYIRRKQQQVTSRQGSPKYIDLYNQLLVKWSDYWLYEFVSDMIAVYLVGPAFGWQHIRLRISNNQYSAYYPTLEEMATHPADEARFRGIISVLNYISATQNNNELKKVWAHYLEVSKEEMPQDYEVCYPQEIIDSLAKRTVESCRKLGINNFQHSINSKDDIYIPNLLIKAWEQFFIGSQSYIEWECRQLESLWQSLSTDLAAATKEED